MTLTLYNTLTRRKEPFEPLEIGKVRMYCCGITVYDYCHLGHARTCIVWDTARRYLQWRGYEVHYVQNFTDIDDKILNRARQEGTSMEDVSERFIQAYFEDMERLNVKKADAYPRATHTLDGIKRLIYELEQKKYPCDFALWKAAKPGEPSWESPWGAGRPGWHIECSAMIREKLGETIDIHTGGADLVFPHHENEIAQSEAVTGKPLAQYWLHTAMVKVEGEKMAKSLGNFITIRDLLDRPVDPMAVRLFVLQAQYRKPIDFSDDAIESATNGWNTLKEGLLFGHQHSEQLGWENSSKIQNPKSKTQNSLVERFNEAVDDDLNFAGGLAVLFEIAKDLRREGNLLVHDGKNQRRPEELEMQWHTLVTLAQVFGLEAQPEVIEEPADRLSDAQIEEMIQQRAEARQAKNFAEGDRIRNELASKGITLIDKPGGVTQWHRN